jgi:hypothetical protein
MTQPGVFRAPGAPVTTDGQLAAACLAHPSVVASYRSAGQLWGLRKVGAPADPEVVLPHGCTTRLGGTLVRRTRRFDRLTVIQRDDGISLTDPASTLALLSDRLSSDAVSSIVEQILHRQWSTVGDLAMTAARLWSSRTPGPAKIRAALTHHLDGEAAVASDLELQALRLFRRAGLPEPVRQLPVRVGPTLTLHPDFVWLEHGLCVEVDHSWWHADRAAVRRDHERDRLLLAAGLVCIRVTEEDIAVGLTEAIALLHLRLVSAA